MIPTVVIVNEQPSSQQRWDAAMLEELTADTEVGSDQCLSSGSSEGSTAE